MRGAPTHLHKSEATVIEKNPIFPRTERVLAESPATLRESCSTEMKRIWPFCPGPTLKEQLNLELKLKIASDGAKVDVLHE